MVRVAGRASLWPAESSCGQWPVEAQPRSNLACAAGYLVTTVSGLVITVVGDTSEHFINAKFYMYLLISLFPFYG